MFGFKYIRDKKMITIGSRIWAFTYIEWDEESRDWENMASDRVFVIHAWRLHLKVSWSRQ